MLLALVAITIVSGTVFYSQYLARKIAKEERLKVTEWAEAGNLLVRDTTDLSTRLAGMIISENQNIPIIWTNEKDSIVAFINLDSSKASTDKLYLSSKIKEFRLQNDPVVFYDPINKAKSSKYYYGHTDLLIEVRYYPLIQLFIVALFILVTIISITSRNKATQNQVWAGMAKETAHQLGTPISSLQGWIEMLKEDHRNDSITTELQKDVDRLKLVSDRFSKIGSTPHLEQSNLVTQIENMVEYIRKRATGKVHFIIDTHGASEIIARISVPLFDWVIENLLKNALDAMEGKGTVIIDIRENENEICTDIKDTGKGISAANLHRVFSPGFTTKKRGWGLGLSLSKRIIEQYHKGELSVKQSELGKGTTFRILLKK